MRLNFLCPCAFSFHGITMLTTGEGAMRRQLIRPELSTTSGFTAPGHDHQRQSHRGTFLARQGTLCPPFPAMGNHPEREPQMCVPARHEKVLDQILEVFEIQPDVELSRTRRNHAVAVFASCATSSSDVYSANGRPSVIIVRKCTTMSLYCTRIHETYSLGFHDRHPVIAAGTARRPLL
jgi:hypothetical protein